LRVSPGREGKGEEKSFVIALGLLERKLRRDEGEKHHFEKLGGGKSCGLKRGERITSWEGKLR